MRGLVSAGGTERGRGWEVPIAKPRAASIHSKAALLPTPECNLQAPWGLGGQSLAGPKTSDSVLFWHIRSSEHVLVIQQACIRQP